MNRTAWLIWEAENKKIEKVPSCLERARWKLKRPSLLLRRHAYSLTPTFLTNTAGPPHRLSLLVWTLGGLDKQKCGGGNRGGLPPFTLSLSSSCRASSGKKVNVRELITIQKGRWRWKTGERSVSLWEETSPRRVEGREASKRATPVESSTCMAVWPDGYITCSIFSHMQQWN